MTITAAADGSALGNPGPAGWAWYVDDSHWAAGGWKHATNNMGELKAVLELFTATAHLDDDLLVLCDSQYAINSITKWMPGWKAKGWRKGDGKPVMNLEILQALDKAIVGRKYRFEWVKGHVGHVLNEAADVRARSAAEAFQRNRPVNGGPGYPGAIAVLESAPTAQPASGVESGAVAEPPSAVQPVETRRPTFAEPPSLFSLGAHDVTVTLNDDEFARLESRARAAGVTLEDALRGLV